MRLLSTRLLIVPRPNNPLDRILQHEVGDLVAADERARQRPPVNGDDQDFLYNVARLVSTVARNVSLITLQAGERWYLLLRYGFSAIFEDGGAFLEQGGGLIHRGCWIGRSVWGRGARYQIYIGEDVKLNVSSREIA